MKIEPPSPFVAMPVPIEIVPLEPSLVVPDENLIDPLTPESPPLDVWIVIEPLVVEDPYPE
jgi:hypothetical protein